ncbi:putative tartrate transporter [Peptococcaceae bacterium CEB3]|nr:putative tartrate transporter [Peptococcaceae bacterium CEB3]
MNFERGINNGHLFRNRRQNHQEIMDPPHPIHLYSLHHPLVSGETAGARLCPLYDGSGRFEHYRGPDFHLDLGLFSNPFIQIIMLSLATIGIYSFFGSFWSLPSLFLTEASAAVGIAIVNSVGNLGGFVGPYAIEALKDATGTVASGLYFLAGSLLVAGILALIIRKEYSTSLFAAADQKEA